MASHSGGAGNGPPRMSRRVAVLVAATVIGAALVGVFLFNRGDASSSLSHVHGLAVNPADGLLYVGTHEGLFRVEEGGRRIKRVGSTSHDLMSLTAAGPDRFLASGHPQQVTRELPANLGLIESVDAGKTWRAVALAGQADLHAMRLADGRLYAYGSGTLAVSTDDGQHWEPVASAELADFVVTKAGNILATTRAGLLRGPAVPGARLTQQTAPALLWLSVGPDAAIWGVTLGGELFRSTDDGTQWERRGLLEGQAGALLASADGLYVALSDGTLYRSADSATTWKRIGK